MSTTDPPTILPGKSTRWSTSRSSSLDGEFNTIPGLAESWTVSEDNLTYTFKIREGVTFHNGRELTADDVLFTMNRVLDPATGAWWRTPSSALRVAITEEQIASDATAIAMGTPVATVPGVGVSFEITAAVRSNRHPDRTVWRLPAGTDARP